MTTSTSTTYSSGSIHLAPGQSVNLQDVTGQYLLNGNWAISFEMRLRAPVTGGRLFSSGTHEDLIMTQGNDKSIQTRKSYADDGSLLVSKEEIDTLPENDVKAYFKYDDDNEYIFMINSFAATDFDVWHTVTMTVSHKKEGDDSIHVTMYTNGYLDGTPDLHIWDYKGSKDTSIAVLGGGVDADFRNVMFWKDTIPSQVEVMQNQTQSPTPPPDKIFYSVPLDEQPADRRTALEAKEREILETFAPVVYLDSDETYKPMAITTYIEKCRLMWDKKKTGAVVLERVVPYTKVNQQSYTDTNWRIPSYSYTEYSSYKKTSKGTLFALVLNNENDRGGTSDLSSVPFYAFACPNADATLCDLTYAFYYPYDGGNDGWFGSLGSHEGDWEHIIVRIGTDSKGKLSTDSPIFGVYYQAHKSGDKYSRWYYPPEGGTPSSESFQWEVVGKRVKVYSSNGSHGSYTTAGTQEYDWWPDDKTSAGPAWGRIPNIQIMTGEEPWNDYNGQKTTPKVQGWLAFDTRPNGPTAPR